LTNDVHVHLHNTEVKDTRRHYATHSLSYTTKQICYKLTLSCTVSKKQKMSKLIGVEQ